MTSGFKLFLLSISLSGWCSTDKTPATAASDQSTKSEIPGSPMNSGVDSGSVPGRPSTQADRQLAQAGIGRSPAPSVLDLRYERNEKTGNYIIKHVNPNGPFKHLLNVKETTEVPRPHF